MIGLRHAAAMTLMLAAGAGAAWGESRDANEIAMAPDGGARATSAWTAERMSRAERIAPAVVDRQAMEAAAELRMSVGEPGSAPAADDRGGGERRALAKPMYWAGQFFNSGPGGDYVCSAQFVSPTVILTAAACARDHLTGAWHTDLVFALGYDEGGKYIEAFDYECVGTKNGWVQEGVERYLYDYALVKIAGRSPTGHFGTHWNWLGEYRDAARVAYPIGSDDEDVPVVDRGSVRVSKGIVTFRHGVAERTAGTLGGALVGDFNQRESSDRGNYVISLDSFLYLSDPGANYGPYLDDAFKDLFDYVEAGCR